MTLCITSSSVVLVPWFSFAKASLSVCFCFNIFHSITASILEFFISYLNLRLPRLAYIPYCAGELNNLFLYNSQDVLPRRREVFGLPVPLLPAQRRYVRRIRSTRAWGTGKDGACRICLRKALQL